MRVPEHVSEASRWLLVAGLAFYGADAASAALADRWVAPPPAMVDMEFAVIPAVVPPQAPPSGLIEMLSTTAPEEVDVATTAPASATSTLLAPESKIPLTLIGVMAASGSSRGVALFESAGKSEVLSTGQRFGDWLLSEVKQTSVTLRRGGQMAVLDLNIPGELTGAVPPPMILPESAVVAPAPEAPSVSPSPAGEAVEPIRTRSELVELIDNQKFSGGAVKAFTREGAIVGYRVGIKDPSFPLARLGLLHGDIIRSVNQVALDGPESLSLVYRMLRNTNDFRFEIERNGAQQALEVKLED